MESNNGSNDTLASDELSERVSELEAIVEALKERNKRVEGDKGWEVSSCRKFLIALITYITTSLVFFLIHSPFPLRDALIPTTGYLLSTLTIPFVKSWWLKRATDEEIPKNLC